MSENTTTTADRTPQDFAIEFAEYMAKDAEALITAINADAEVRLRIAESDDVSDDDEEDAQATVSEMQRALQSDIYEFRKRRDRAASAASPSPQAADTGATVPLTKRQISDIYFEALGQERPALIDHGCIERFARLVERHHGIREGGQHG